MSTGSYSSANNPDSNDDWYGGQGGYNSRQYGYNDGVAMQDGMTTQPSVGRFTEQEKAGSMFARKPATPKNYDVAGQPGVHYSGHDAQSNAGGIVNLRAAPPRGDGKMNKSTSKGKK